MYSEQTIAQIHRDLQALDLSALVLLGGSYVYGEAGEESDVDFYWLCPSWRVFFLFKLKKKVKELRGQYPDIDFSVMIVPQWLRRHGYYIYGQDVNEKIFTWGLPFPTLIRNCLKLAYYNHLRSIVEPKGKERNIQKTRKQLAVAELARQGKIDFNRPIFSWNYINERLNANQQLTLDGAHSRFQSYFTFSFSNYLLYNVRFLLRGNPLFLLKNPDKMIIKQLKESFDKQEDPVKLYNEIKEIIFPVIIL
jgi:hypothetical protein